MPLQQSFGAALLCVLVFSAVTVAARPRSSPVGLDVMASPAVGMPTSFIGADAAEDIRLMAGPRFYAEVQRNGMDPIPLAAMPSLTPGVDKLVAQGRCDPASGRRAGS